MPQKVKPEGILEFEAPAQPYSACVQIGNHFHFSGVVAVDEHKMPDGDPQEQIIKVLQKMIDLLVACGLTHNDVFSAIVALADMRHYKFLNGRWDVAFGNCRIKPRRMVFAVSELPFGCAVEILFDAVKQTEDKPKSG